MSGDTNSNCKFPDEVNHASQESVNLEGGGQLDCNANSVTGQDDLGVVEQLLYDDDIVRELSEESSSSSPSSSLSSMVHNNASSMLSDDYESSVETNQSQSDTVSVISTYQPISFENVQALERSVPRSICGNSWSCSSILSVQVSDNTVGSQLYIRRNSVDSIGNASVNSVDNDDTAMEHDPLHPIPLDQWGSDFSDDSNSNF